MKMHRNIYSVKGVIYTGSVSAVRTREYSSTLLPGVRTTFVLHCQASSFSSKVPKSKVAAVPPSDDEELNSDKDEDSDVETEDILVSVIKKGKPLSPPEWDDVKNKVFTTNRSVKEYNIDAIIMGLCTKFTQRNVGLSYMNYLSSSNKKLNIATIKHFMKMCYHCRASGVDEQLVLSMYEDLRSRCSVLDAYTAEGAILGLCLTKRWKEGLELLDMVKLTCSPGGLEYNALIKAAFDNNEPSLSFELLDEMLQLGRRVKPDVYHAWLDYCDRTSKSNPLKRWAMVQEQLLMALVENDLIPTLDVVDRIRNWYMDTENSNSKLHAEYTTLATRGICKSCRRTLNPFKITNSEFGRLQSAFLDKVVVGTDIFKKSTPAELKEFQNFVKMSAPYDMVIDGLNIAFAAGNKASPQFYAKILHHVVKHFVTKSKKVLVLGRKHMQTWPARYMDYIYKNAHIFLAQNLSHDDPLLLYATLYSGLGTNFLSRDLMRGHAYILKDKALRTTFRQWQLQHQCQLKYVTEQGKVHLKFPLPFNPMPQVSADGTWHIPYDMEFVQHPPQTFEAPITWLCLTSNIQDTKLKPPSGQVRRKNFTQLH
ncbi:mitochondrial ribonuclease P catalytic subunit isoform X2 [Periplaneta americana]|uniref:mitochondrial ribonuclease P catalytic subunit isoform X2 n=1 Tax=Periplaneta americana TaxID=6978 RepID=UPI0037E95829